MLGDQPAQRVGIHSDFPSDFPASLRYTGAAFHLRKDEFYPSLLDFLGYRSSHAGQTSQLRTKSVEIGSSWPSCCSGT